MDALTRIADPKIKQAALVEAIQQLGPVTEEPGFWSAIANDERYSPDHRRRAIYELFRRHITSGMSLAEVADVLDDPIWLKDEEISLVTIISGRLPVKWSMADSIFVLPIFSDLPDRQYAYWAVYLKVAGKIDREPFIDAIHGRPVEQAAARATVLEIGLVPADPSPDAD